MTIFDQVSNREHDQTKAYCGATANHSNAQRYSDSRKTASPTASMRALFKLSKPNSKNKNLASRARGCVLVGTSVPCLHLFLYGPHRVKGLRRLEDDTQQELDEARPMVSHSLESALQHL